MTHTSTTRTPTTNGASPQTNGNLTAAQLITSQLTSALEAERQRLERIYLHRQQSLLRGISSALNENLGAIVRNAIERESKVFVGGANKEGNKEVLKCFRGAFEGELLGRIEKGVREVLGGVADCLDGGIEKMVVGPVGKVGEELKGVVGGLKGLEGMSGGGDGNRKRFEVLRGEVEGLLKEGKVREGLNLVFEKGDDVKDSVLGFVLRGLLELKDVDPETVFGEPVGMDKGKLIKITEILSRDLEDRVDSRLFWMTEAVMAIEDEDEDVELSAEVVNDIKAKAEVVANALDNLQKSGTLSAPQAKQCKILLHVLRSQIEFAD